MARAAAAARTEPSRSTARAAPSRRQPGRAAPAKRPTRRSSGRVTQRRAATAPRRAAAATPRGARVLDTLLSGRVWIGLVGVLLAGIVFFNVDLMRMNRQITAMADQAAQLKRENARTRLDVARLASSERIQQVAAELGLVLPAPDAVRYLEANPAVDARNASKRIIAPAETFAAPVITEPEPLAPVTPATTTTTTTVPPTTTTPPASTATASPTG
jgi:cell division protein FtsL